MAARGRRAPIAVATLGALGLAALLAGTLASPADPETRSIVPADPLATYDPVAAGEALPRGYRPLLERDQIFPVYNPEFAAAGAIDWPADSLVIGVASGSAAKAYPVNHLNSREMVIDSIAGIPILVTW